MNLKTVKRKGKILTDISAGLGFSDMVVSVKEGDFVIIAR